MLVCFFLECLVSLIERLGSEIGKRRPFISRPQRFKSTSLSGARRTAEFDLSCDDLFGISRFVGRSWVNPPRRVR